MLQPRLPYQTSRNISVSLGGCILFILFLCFSFVFVLPTLLAIILGWSTLHAFDRREFTRGLIAVAVGGVLLYGLWTFIANPWPWFWSVLLTDLPRQRWPSLGWGLVWFWVYHLFLAPAYALALTSLWQKLLDLTKAKPQTVVLRHDASIATLPVSQAQAQFAQMTTVASSQPLSVERSSDLSLPLGAYLRGDLNEFVVGGEVCLSASFLGLHGVLTGEPQYGKTWTLLQLALIARQQGRKVIYIDMKGSRKTAALFLAAMNMLNIGRVKLYPLEAYDGWRGTTKSLYNRLMEQIDPRTHPFYRSGVGSSLLSLAINAPGGMPKNSYQFLERLNGDWLKATYVQDAQALREIQAMLSHINGLQLVMGGFFRGIAGGLDGSWAFEDVDACYIGIDSIAHKEESSLLGRYVLEDAADYAVNRKASEERVLLIIDEFGGLRSANATALYEKVRESEMSIYASGQSYQSLGIERDSILAASSVKILHRSGSPKPILEYAGERERYIYTRTIGDEHSDEDLQHPLANRPFHRNRMRQTMMQPQKELTVAPEDVQQLAAGQIVLISGGKATFARVYPLTLPPYLLDAARLFLANAPRFTPLPPPLQGQKKKIAPVSAAPQKDLMHPSLQSLAPASVAQDTVVANSLLQHEQVQPSSSLTAAKQGEVQTSLADDGRIDFFS